MFARSPDTELSIAMSGTGLGGEASPPPAYDDALHMAEPVHDDEEAMPYVPIAEAVEDEEIEGDEAYVPDGEDDEDDEEYEAHPDEVPEEDEKEGWGLDAEIADPGSLLFMGPAAAGIAAAEAKLEPAEPEKKKARCWAQKLENLEGVLNHALPNECVTRANVGELNDDLFEDRRGLPRTPTSIAKLAKRVNAGVEDVNLKILELKAKARAIGEMFDRVAVDKNTLRRLKSATETATEADAQLPEAEKKLREAQAAYEAMAAKASQGKGRGRGQKRRRV